MRSRSHLKSHNGLFKVFIWLASCHFDGFAPISSDLFASLSCRMASYLSKKRQTGQSCNCPHTTLSVFPIIPVSLTAMIWTAVEEIVRGNWFLLSPRIQHDLKFRSSAAAVGNESRCSLFDATSILFGRSFLDTKEIHKKYSTVSTSSTHLDRANEEW